MPSRTPLICASMLSVTSSTKTASIGGGLLAGGRALIRRSELAALEALDLGRDAQLQAGGRRQDFHLDSLRGIRSLVVQAAGDRVHEVYTRQLGPRAQRLESGADLHFPFGLVRGNGERGGRE